MPRSNSSTELRAFDARLTRIARSSALAAGVGAGLGAVCAGGAVWGALALGTSAVREGALSGVTLAVVVLIPLAAFEAVQVLPTAALAYSRSRQSGERVIELMETPAPVTEPVRRSAVGSREPVADFVASCGRALARHAIIGARRGHGGRP